MNPLYAAWQKVVLCSCTRGKEVSTRLHFAHESYHCRVLSVMLWKTYNQSVMVVPSGPTLFIPGNTFPGTKIPRRASVEMVSGSRLFVGRAHSFSQVCVVIISCVFTLTQDNFESHFLSSVSCSLYRIHLVLCMFFLHNAGTNFSRLGVVQSGNFLLSVFECFTY